MTLFGFPARGIDLLIGRPASRIEIGEQLDVDDALLRLALDGIAQRAGPARPPGVMVHIAEVEPMAVAGGFFLDPPARATARDGKLRSFGDRVEGRQEEHTTES